MKRKSIHNFLETLKFGRPYVGHLILASFLNLVTVCSDLGFLYLLKRLIDTGLATQNIVQLKLLALAALGLLLVRSVFGYTGGYLLTYVDGRMANDIQDSLYARIQKLSMDFHMDNSIGNLLALIFCRTLDMLKIITSLSGTLVKELLRIPALIIFLFYLHNGLAVFALLVFPPALLCLRLFRNLITRATQQTHETLSRLYTTAEQALSHIEAIKIFAKENLESERFQRLNQEMLSNSIAAYKAAGLSTPAVQMLKMLGVTVLVFVGTHKVTQGELSIGGLTTFLASAYYLYGGLSSLTSWYLSLISGLMSADKVFEVLNTQPSVESPVNGIKLRTFENVIIVGKISFSYSTAQKDVLKEINLHFKKGETIAFVGPSGSGKSTLVKLLLRLYDPVKGGIFIDGYKLSDLDLPALRGLFGVAPQEPGIFQDSVTTAIAYGRPGASPNEIREAAHLAGAHEFIVQLPHGYDTLIGERDIKLSGGEKQRLALARAILRDPEILILDEALSSVDAPTEKVILQRISTQRRRKTTILISHRLGSIRHADRIVVIEGGIVAEEGTHQALMADSKKYRRWFLAQQSE
jgi:subfamily B ATP-binding cassette protein MsbA